MREESQFKKMVLRLGIRNKQISHKNIHTHPLVVDEYIHTYIKAYKSNYVGCERRRRRRVSRVVVKSRRVTPRYRRMPDAAYAVLRMLFEKNLCQPRNNRKVVTKRVSSGSDGIFTIVCVRR